MRGCTVTGKRALMSKACSGPFGETAQAATNDPAIATQAFRLSEYRVMAESPLLNDVANGVIGRPGGTICVLAVDRVQPAAQDGVRIGRNHKSIIRSGELDFADGVDQIS